MSRIHIIVSAVCLFFVGAGCKNNNTVIDSNNFYKGEVDATPAFVGMINCLNQNGGGTLNIESGVYHFYPDKAVERFCHISNHDDGLRYTPFPIINMKDVAIINGINIIFNIIPERRILIL